MSGCEEMKSRKLTSCGVERVDHVPVSDEDVRLLLGTILVRNCSET